MQLEIDVTHDLLVLNQHLTALYQRLNGDLTPLLESIGQQLTGSTIERFANKQTSDGVRWADLLPQTQRQKGNNNILVGKEISGLRDILNEVTAQSVIVGTDKHYGKYHQLGTQNMVARPFLGLSVDDKSTINELIESFINGDL